MKLANDFGVDGLSVPEWSIKEVISAQWSSGVLVCSSEQRCGCWWRCESFTSPKGSFQPPLAASSLESWELARREPEKKVLLVLFCDPHSISSPHVNCAIALTSTSGNLNASCWSTAHSKAEEESFMKVSWLDDWIAACIGTRTSSVLSKKSYSKFQLFPLTLETP
ncbi:uncharacterized [Tachysurus ichikawai]